MKAITFRLLAVLALVLVLGCSEESLVGVERGETSLNPETTVIAVGKNAKMVPLQGKGTLTVVPAAGTVDCEAPDGTVVAAFPAQFDALAQYSHLGRTIGVITVDACHFSPADGTLLISGEALQTAASGDELHATYEATFLPDFSFSLEITVAGGTGRFEGASGWAVGGGAVDLTTGSGETRLDGEISTVGSI